MTQAPSAAETLAEKLEAFAAGLSDEERHLLGVAIVAAAESETSGFSVERPRLRTFDVLNEVAVRHPFRPGRRDDGNRIGGTTIFGTTPWFRSE